MYRSRSKNEKAVPAAACAHIYSHVIVLQGSLGLGLGIGQQICWDLDVGVRVCLGSMSLSRQALLPPHSIRWEELTLWCSIPLSSHNHDISISNGLVSSSCTLYKILAASTMASLLVCDSNQNVNVIRWKPRPKSTYQEQRAEVSRSSSPPAGHLGELELLDLVTRQLPPLAHRRAVVPKAGARGVNHV